MQIPVACESGYGDFLRLARMACLFSIIAYIPVDFPPLQIFNVFIAFSAFSLSETLYSSPSWLKAPPESKRFSFQVWELIGSCICWI